MFPAPRPQAASLTAVYSVSLLKAECSPGQLRQDEPVQLRAVKQEPEGEWVPVQRAEQASLRLERQRAPVLLAWEQFSGLRAQQMKKPLGQLPAPPV